MLMASFLLHFLGLIWLIALAICDIRSGKLPNLLTVNGTIVGLIVHAFNHNIGACLAGISLGYGSLFLVNLCYQAWRKRPGLGSGDAKMLAMLGCWLGPTLVLPILAWGSILSCLYAATHLIWQQQIPKQMPFGPFLAAATCILTMP